MRTLQTKPAEADFPWSEMPSEDRSIIRRELKALSEPETSELDTGKRIVEVRSILEKYGIFWRFLEILPFTSRTAYRRIKSYERAVEMWPKEVLDAAIERKLKIFGWTNERPMGLYEGLDAPPKNLTPSKIEDYLAQAELQVRSRGTSQGGLGAYDSLRQVFRMVAGVVRGLPEKEREKFLNDLVGLEMTLLGAKGSQRFSPAQIPQEFWATPHGAYTRSQSTRERTRASALARHERLRKTASG